MTTNISDHDKRQLGRMKERLELYEQGQVSLRVLIADLEFLLSTLEDNSIRRELREEWGVLEEVYSVAIAMHGGKVYSHGESLVTHAVKELGRVSTWLASAPEPEGDK
jgi:hypothetical protein